MLKSTSRESQLLFPREFQVEAGQNLSQEIIREDAFVEEGVSMG